MVRFRESRKPANRPLSDHFYEDFFNATMTYRLDSDIVWTYGIVKDVHNGQTVAPDRDARWEAFYNRAAGNQSHGSEDASSSKMFRRKVRPIIWFVSNCQAKSGRQEYVDELSRHIPIDVYGKCGTMYCPPSVDCFKQVVEPHYFSTSRSRIRSATITYREAVQCPQVQRDPNRVRWRQL